MTARLIVDVCDLDNNVRAAVAYAAQKSYDSGADFEISYVVGDRTIEPETHARGYGWLLSARTNATLLAPSQLPWRLSQAFVFADLDIADHSVLRATPALCREDLRAASRHLNNTTEGPPQSTWHLWVAEVVTTDGNRYRLVPRGSSAMTWRKSDTTLGPAERSDHFTSVICLHAWLDRVGREKWRIGDARVNRLEIVEYDVTTTVAFHEWVYSYKRQTN